jgi:hypothetical protein
MNLRNRIITNYNNMEADNPLFKFYDEASDYVEEMSEDEIVSYLENERNKYLFQAKKAEETNKSPKKFNMISSEIADLLSQVDRRPQQVEQVRQNINYGQSYNEIAEDIYEKNRVNRLNMYQIFAIVFSSLLFIGTIVLTTQVPSDRSAEFFLTYSVYTALIFFLLFGFGELIKNQKKTHYYLTKLIKMNEKK